MQPKMYAASFAASSFLSPGQCSWCSQRCTQPAWGPRPAAPGPACPGAPPPPTCAPPAPGPAWAAGPALPGTPASQPCSPSLQPSSPEHGGGAHSSPALVDAGMRAATGARLQGECTQASQHHSPALPALPGAPEPYTLNPASQLCSLSLCPGDRLRLGLIVSVVCD